MSRLNGDVVDAQSVLTNTFITITTNIVMVISTLAIILSLERWLTLLSVAIAPYLIWPPRRVGRLLREIRRESMELNAKMMR